MREILSKSSYFLIFSGFVSWLLFGSNIYEKLVNIHEKYHVECQKGLVNTKLSKDLYYMKLINVESENFENKAYTKNILNGY